MTSLLCKLFIKESENTKKSTVRWAYGTLASVVGIILNILLAAVKMFVGVLTSSISVTADAVNNLSDAGSQVVSLISFKISAKPADRDHPFGHARIEYVASMIVSFIILTIGFELFRSSLEKVFDPEPTKLGILPALILVLSVAVKLWIAIFNRKIGKMINSSVIKATAIDSLSDALATTAVLVSMIISHLTGFVTDGYMGMIVSVFIFVAGIKILAETKNSILGSAPDDETVSEISRITLEYPEILGIHDMIVHNYGAGNTIASLHAEVDGTENVFVTHDVIDNIEKRLYTELGVRATIHMDPIVLDDERVDALKSTVSELVKQIDDRLTIHDFRFVEGNTHSNLIFDISAPFELKMSDDEIKKRVSGALNKINPCFFAVITVDRQ
ncbi:MAG: cation transporter [Clostridia bacterium]|nr:cation transporter [Clostridia bacterium]